MNTLINVVIGYYLVGAIILVGSFAFIEWRISRFKKGKLVPSMKDIAIFAQYAVFKSKYAKSSLKFKVKFWSLQLTLWIFFAATALIQTVKEMRSRG